MKNRLLALCLAICVLGSVSSCGKVSEPTESEETIATNHTARRIEGVSYETFEETPTPVPTTSSVPYDENETYYTLYTQQTDPWDADSLLDTSQLVVPSYDYASQRVELTSDVFLGYDANLTTDQGHLLVYYVDWHDDSQHSVYFELDGVITPFDLDVASDHPVYMSFAGIIDRVMSHGDLLVYVEIVGEEEDRGDYYPWAHGYISYCPIENRYDHGVVGSADELLQLNEWLLAHGFAEPDRNYSGPYAAIYQQYPDFQDRFAYYPLLQPNESVTDFNFILFNPDAPVEALSIINYDEYGVTY